MFTDIKCSLNWIINIFSSISELFLLCTTCASSPLKMTRRKMELNSPWPWHFSIAFLASFPQHLCCDSLVSSQHLSLPMVPGETSWGCFLKGKGRNPTNPNETSRNEHWIRIPLWISCACSGLEKTSILQLPKFLLLGSSTVLYTTGKCHCKWHCLK